ncbi:MAG: threonine--tRNA ligase [Deltaproteobacteria bacterium]|nr:threonine--tRNA ligase [Deltaproteobacteria bacterium]
MVCRAGHEDDPLERMRHSAAHVMADAVQQLFPQAKVTIGPAIEQGFYYDFDYAPGFTPDDLVHIEARMHEIIARNLPFTREEVSKADARRLFTEKGETFKIEILDGIPDDSVTLYRHGAFVDLCKGPHVARTGDIKAIKLLKVAGAYWRGDEHNPMLQRIYGTAFLTDAELQLYLQRLEEAKERDHRRLGSRLDLFSMHPIAPGSPFFHPKGTVVYNALQEYVRTLYRKYGYSEVVTPQVFKTELWKTSGHYEAFRSDMFLMAVDEEEYGLKPMNCPGHCYLFGLRKPSYRELPIRYADFGRLHRFEPSGTLMGLTRVRSMAQDDAHIFCTPEQLDQELTSFIAMTREVYATFGFERIEVTLQTRPEKFLGTIERWTVAEAALRRSLEQAGFQVTELPGEGAFYGPKIGFDFRDVLDRAWTLATVQIDCAMPERFGLAYITPEGCEAVPMMLHRAILGTLERFIAILLEHTGGKLPLWLAPVQAVVLPIVDASIPYAHEVRDALAAAGLRVTCDERSEKLGAKIRDAQLEQIPYMLVVGKREAADRKVAVRARSGGDLGAMTIEDCVQRLQTEVDSKHV